MYSVKLHHAINQITSLFYRIGLWHSEEEPTAKDIRLKIFFSIYYLLFPASLITGAIQSDNKDESIFLVEVAILILVTSLKFFYIIWKKKEILALLNQMCVYTINDSAGFKYVNDKLNGFMKFVYFVFVPPFLAALCAVLIVPFIGSEKKLFFAIGFPLDYKNDEIAYWTAFAFIFTQILLTAIALLFTPIFWYLMINCWLKYDLLGHHIIKMGEFKMIETTGRQSNFSMLEKANIFYGDLIENVQFHRRIREEIQQMVSFLSPVFLAQITTSALCICASIYILIFNVSENLIEYMITLIMLFYNIFEIFTVMYFGNEIKLSSDRLTYCLFQSNWIGQPQSTKKCLLIFGEIIKQPHVILVGKLYPLTLETFTRILNSAYSMFNILKNVK